MSVVTALSVKGLSGRGWDCAVIAPRYPAGRNNGVFGHNASASGAQAVAGEELTTVPSLPLPVYPDIRLCLPSPWRVRRAFAAFGPDLVHCATEGILGRLGQREARRAGLPVVTSYHTEFAQYMHAYGVSWLYSPVSRYVTAFHRRAVLTFTPGRPARDALLASGVHHAQVWGRGVDTELFNRSRRDEMLRKRLGIDTRFAFLLVTRLAPEKGVQVVLDAYREACTRLAPDSTRLIIAGAGPERGALEAHAPPGTMFLGFVERKHALPSLYASCDAFAYASTTETLGLVVLEAMSASLPVIAVPAGGVTDHLSDGENGLAYPANDVSAMADAMVLLTTDAARRQQLAAGARATAEGLTWDAELDRLDEILRAKIEKRKDKA